MANKKKKTVTQLGKQPPLYRFFLNPYQDVRFTSFPQCTSKLTGGWVRDETKLSAKK